MVVRSWLTSSFTFSVNNTKYDQSSNVQTSTHSCFCISQKFPNERQVASTKRSKKNNRTTEAIPAPCQLCHDLASTISRSCTSFQWSLFLCPRRGWHQGLLHSTLENNFWPANNIGIGCEAVTFCGWLHNDFLQPQAGGSTNDL